MSLTKQYKTDQAKTIEGVPVTFAPNADGSIPTIYVSRMHDSNPQYAAKLAHESKPFSRQLANKTLPDETARKITKTVFVSAVLKGWQNVLLSDVTGIGSDTGFAEFNAKNAGLLVDNLPDLYVILLEEATNMSRFMKEDLEEEAKN